MSATGTDAAVLIIGNEVLSGRTADSNLPYIADRLTQLGIPVREARVVPDVLDTIADAVNALRHAHTYVFTTGGIGPTHDDVTCDAVARAFDLPVIEHPDARARLEAHYDPADLNEARLRMARTPAGARLIDNPVSAAPGFRVANVHVLAGVPRIAQAMFEGVKDGLAGGAPVVARTVVGFVAEGTVADRLRTVQADFPDAELGSYPFFRNGRLGTSVVVRHTDPERLDAATRVVERLMEDLGAAPEVVEGAA